jgi:hypothetical protein
MRTLAVTPLLAPRAAGADARTSRGLVLPIVVFRAFKLALAALLAGLVGFVFYLANQR